MGFLPSGLYAPTATAAMFAAATEQEQHQQRRAVAAYSPAEASIKPRALMTAFAPSEKTIALHSWVGAKSPRPALPAGPAPKPGLVLCPSIAPA